MITGAAGGGAALYVGECCSSFEQGRPVMSLEDG